MPVHNIDIATAFDEIADLLEIEEANPFRVRAYRNAARMIRGMGTELSELVAQGEDLSKLPTIGKDLAAKIEEMVSSGKVKALDKLHHEVPASLEKLLHLPGLGPKRVKAVYHQLGVKTEAQLKRAAEQGRLRQLSGFGPKIEQQVLEALAAHKGEERRFLRHVAARYAAPLVHYLAGTRGVEQVVVAGSYRRGRETVGDLDILVTAAPHSEVMSRFIHYDEVAHVVSQGETRATVELKNGLQVDLRLVAPESFGSALHYFTGSKAHNIQIRRLGQQRGLKINEYGVFKGEQRVAGESEESVFASVSLPYITPTLREGRGEIEAAREHRLPKLVTLNDLQGDLHVHTNATDGSASLEAMALAAKAHGLKYIAITEHSHHLTVAHGLSSDRLLQQVEEIDRLNDRLHGITILKGIEVDILEDGSLDLPDDVLSRLDLVVGAIHGKFRLPRKKQTERLLRAMDSPYFSILAHPTGRLLQSREPYAVDMERIIAKAQQRGCFLELNSQPVRLDLNDVHSAMAREAGVLVSINSDAHREQDYDFLVLGVEQAQRGWLEKEDVLNALPLRKLKARLRSTMG